METNTIDPALLGRNRAVIESWGIIGKKLFTVRATPVDLNWNDKIKNNDPLRLVKPIMKYSIESIEVISTALRVAPDNSTLLIELNENTNLQFKLAPAKFCEVTLDKIKEAIASNENKETGRTPIFFRDSNALTSQVNRLNDLEKAKCDQIAEEMLAMSQALSDLNKLQADANDRYYEELGKDSLA